MGRYYLPNISQKKYMPEASIALFLPHFKDGKLFYSSKMWDRGGRMQHAFWDGKMEKNKFGNSRTIDSAYSIPASFPSSRNPRRQGRVFGVFVSLFDLLRYGEMAVGMWAVKTVLDFFSDVFENNTVACNKGFREKFLTCCLITFLHNKVNASTAFCH